MNDLATMNREKFVDGGYRVKQRQLFSNDGKPSLIRVGEHTVKIENNEPRWKDT